MQKAPAAGIHEDGGAVEFGDLDAGVVEVEEDGAAALMGSGIIGRVRRLTHVRGTTAAARY